MGLKLLHFLAHLNQAPITIKNIIFINNSKFELNYLTQHKVKFTKNQEKFEKFSQQNVTKTSSSAIINFLNFQNFPNKICMFKMN